MPISESLKKKASGLAAQAAAKAEEVKAGQKASGDSRIIELDKKIAALKQSGGFKNTIENLELQKIQIKNKLKNSGK